MADRIIPIREVKTNTAIKNTLITHLVSMGLDWLTEDSTWDEVFQAIALVGSIGFDVPISEVVNRAISLGSIPYTNTVTTVTDLVSSDIYNLENFTTNELSVSRSISVSTISISNPVGITSDYLVETENNDITVAVIDNPVASLNVSDTHQLAWTGSTTLGTPIIVTDWVFTSSFANITVSNTGLVTAVDIGEATIRMESRADSGVYDEFIVTVS